MFKDRIRKLFSDLGQDHLMEGIEELSSDQQEHFLNQIGTRSLLEEQRAAIIASPQPEEIVPLFDADQPDKRAEKKGEQLIAEGKVACLVLAGGDGSRLRAKLPKALVPVTPIKGKTLLHRLSERTLALSRKYDVLVKMAIITSPSNHLAIANYLEENNCFGLLKEQVALLVQGSVPLLNQDKNWFLRAPGLLAVGPDGNGSAFRLLLDASIVAQWKRGGIEWVGVVPIDNPLGDPFDPTLLGHSHISESELAIKAIGKQSFEEQLGAIVREKEKIVIREYSESKVEAPFGYTALFCCRLDFLERVAPLSLPWHAMKKQYPSGPVWKCERFLFDTFPYAESSSVLLYPREKIYAPLKNCSGTDTILTVQQALLNFDKAMLSRIVKGAIPSHPIELDPALYYSPVVASSFAETHSYLSFEDFYF